MDQSKDNVRPRDRDESGADKAVVSMKDGGDYKSQSKLSVKAKEFVPRALDEQLAGMSVSAPPPGMQRQNFNSPSSSDPQRMMQASANAFPDGISRPPMARARGFQPHTSDNHRPVPQQTELYYAKHQRQGQAHTKKNRGGKKSPFTFSHTDLPTFMCVPPGSRKQTPNQDLDHRRQTGNENPCTKATTKEEHSLQERPSGREQGMAAKSVQSASNYQGQGSSNNQQWKKDNRRPQMEQTNRDNVRISQNTHPHDHVSSRNYSRAMSHQNWRYDKSTTSEKRIPPKRSSSQQGPTNPSKSRMPTEPDRNHHERHAQRTYNSNRQPREKNFQRSQELLSNDDRQVQTVRHLLDSGDKVLIMMRGCPGSGKSTLARQLRFDGVILSTDDFFVSDDGRYLYKQDKLEDAHQWNQQRALNNMTDGVSPIIIDNTNIQAWEMKPYVMKGREHGYNVKIFEPNTHWKFNAGKLARCNSHDVPEKRIKGMIERYDRHVTIDQILRSSGKPRTRAVQEMDWDDDWD